MSSSGKVSETKTKVLSAEEKKQQLARAYRAFNDRSKLFLTDMTTVFGKDSPTLRELKLQLETFLRSDPARMRMAHLAWPQFNRHRALINDRKEEVLFLHDISGLKSKAKLDVEKLFKGTSDSNREQIWNAIEDMLDLLDDINKLRPIPTDEDDSDPDAVAQKKSRLAGSSPSLITTNYYEALDFFHPVSSLKPVDEDETEEEQKEEQKEEQAKPKAKPKATSKPPGSSASPGSGASAGAEGPAQWTRALMSNLKEIIGGDDAEIDEDFEQLMSKLTSDAEDGKTSSQDQETMTRILHHFIDKISPMGGAGGGGEDDDLENMSEKEKESELSRRKMEEIRLRNELKYVIGKLTDIESLQKTDDPVILENERQEIAAEAERMKNPDKNREYTITAHFNHKLLLFLNKLREVRGTLTSKKDGRILFPAIANSFVKLLAMFKENPGTETVIRPIGEWIDVHRQQLLNRDDKLFLEPDHPFLVEMNSAALWSTFKPHERVNFWSLVGHPLQLATIFHHLDNEDLRDIADIVNDLLAAGQIAYDRDPNTLNGKNVITKAIKRGCTTHKIGKIRLMFEKMQKDSSQSTLKRLAKLMQNVLPQAAGLRGNNRSHNEDDESVGAMDPAEEKASRDRSEAMQNTFQKILQSMPSLGAIPEGKEQPSKKPSNSAAAAAAPVVGAEIRPTAASSSAPAPNSSPPTPQRASESAPTTK